MASDTLASVIDKGFLPSHNDENHCLKEKKNSSSGKLNENLKPSTDIIFVTVNS